MHSGFPRSVFFCLLRNFFRIIQFCVEWTKMGCKITKAAVPHTPFLKWLRPNYKSVHYSVYNILLVSQKSIMIYKFEKGAFNGKASLCKRYFHWRFFFSSFGNKWPTYTCYIDVYLATELSTFDSHLASYPISIHHRSRAFCAAKITFDSVTYGILNAIRNKLYQELVIYSPCN